MNREGQAAQSIILELAAKTAKPQAIQQLTAMDDYTRKWVRLIKDAAGDEEQLNAIVEKIYAEGFEDGANSEGQ